MVYILDKFKKLNSKLQTRIKRHLRVKKNKRRIHYISGMVVILLLVASLGSTHSESTQRQRRIEYQTKTLRELHTSLQAVQKQKAVTEQQVKQKADSEAHLKAQVDDLNKQLQSKAEAKRQSLIAKAAAPLRPAAASAASSGCVSGYSTGNSALNQIISHESGGNSCATNAGGCFGLLQACPGSPLRQACGGNPSCQIAWFQANKTGGRSWEAIWALWQRQGWW